MTIRLKNILHGVIYGVDTTLVYFSVVWSKIHYLFSVEWSKIRLSGFAFFWLSGYGLTVQFEHHWARSNSNTTKEQINYFEISTSITLVLTLVPIKIKDLPRNESHSKFVKFWFFWIYQRTPRFSGHF